MECVVCTEKLKRNVKTEPISAGALSTLAEEFGTRKPLLVELCNEAKVGGVVSAAGRNVLTLDVHVPSHGNHYPLPCTATPQICQRCYFQPQLSGSWANDVRSQWRFFAERHDPMVTVLELLVPELLSVAAQQHKRRTSVTFENHGAAAITVDQHSTDVILATLFVLLAQYNIPVHAQVQRMVDQYRALQPPKDATYVKSFLIEGLMLGTCPILGIPLEGVAAAAVAVQSSTANLTEDRLQASLKAAQMGAVSISNAIVMAVEKWKADSTDIAAKSLVYNATLLLWRVLAPFLAMEDVTWAQAPLERASEALATTDDDDREWRVFLVRNVINLASTAGAAVSNLAEMCSSALDLCMAPGSPQLALTIKTIVGVASKRNDSALKQLLVTVGSSNPLIPLLLEVDSTTGSNNVDFQSYVDRVLAVRNAASEAPGKATESLSSSILVQVGKLAIAAHKFDVAENAIAAVEKYYNDEAGSILTIYLQVERMALTDGLHSDEATSRKSVAIRLETLDFLRGGILKAVQYNQHFLVESGCWRAWNLLLPLLQNNLKADLRHAVLGMLNVCAEALSATRSTQRALRCHIHVELAKLLETDQLIAKALGHVHEALLNVSSAQSKYRTDQIEPIHYRLKIKMNPQSSNPSFTEEKALFLLEQALVADESLAKKLLEQAVKMTFLNFKYTDVNLIKEKATLPNCAVQWGKGRAASVERRKLCFDIMCAVLVLARKHQIWQLAFEVAGIILDSDWMLDESTYHLKQQVEAAMIKGTCLIQMLGVLRTPPPESGTTVPSDDGSAASTPPLLHAHHQLVVDAFLNAHKLSQKIANIDVRERLGFNSVVYLHNYFVMVSRNVRNYEPWMPTYQRLFEKLRPLDRFVDSDLYMGVCEVLARAILAAYSRVYGSSDEKEVKKKPAAKASSTKAAAAAEKAIGVDLDSIELVCQSGIKSGSKNIAIRMAIIEIMYRAGMLRGFAPELIECSGDGEALSAIVYLESVVALGKDVIPEHKLTANKAGTLLMELSSTGVNPGIMTELFARLAGVSYEIGDLPLAIECCKHALADPPAAVDSSTEAAKNLFKWTAAAHKTYGQTLSLKATDCKGSTEEIVLLAAALEHYAAAVKLFGPLVAQQYALMMTCLKLAYNIAVKKIVPKSKYVKHLEVAVEHTATALKADKSLLNDADMEFLVSLVLLLLDAQASELRWNEGVNVIDAAMPLLPRKQDSLLWQLKVVFLTKTGKGKAEIIKILGEANESPEVTAKIWYTLAQASDEAEKKKSAFLNAINALPDENINKPVYLVEYAAWNFGVLGTYEESVNSVRLAQQQVQSAMDKESDARLLAHKTLLLQAFITEMGILQTATEKLAVAKNAHKCLLELMQKTQEDFGKIGVPEPVVSTTANKKETKRDPMVNSVDIANEKWPVASEDWATFDWAANVRFRVRTDASSRSVISRAHFAEPHAFVIALGALATFFEDMGLSFEALAVVSCMELISSEILSSTEISAHLHFMSARILQRIGLTHHAAMRRKFAEGKLLIGSTTIAGGDTFAKHTQKCTAVLQTLWLREVSYHAVVQEMEQVERIGAKILDSCALYRNDTAVAEVKQYLVLAEASQKLSHESIRTAQEAMRSCKNVSVYGSILVTLAQLWVDHGWVDRAKTIVDEASLQLATLAQGKHVAYEAKRALAAFLLFRARNSTLCEHQDNDFEAALVLYETLGYSVAVNSTLLEHAMALYERGQKDSALARISYIKALLILGRINMLPGMKAQLTDEAVMTTSGATGEDAAPSLQSNTRKNAVTESTPAMPSFILAPFFVAAQAIVLRAKVHFAMAMLEEVAREKAKLRVLTIEEKIREYVADPTVPDPSDADWKVLISQQERFFDQLEVEVKALKDLPAMQLQTLTTLMRYHLFKARACFKNAAALDTTLVEKLRRYAFDVIVLALLGSEYKLASEAGWLLLDDKFKTAEQNSSMLLSICQACDNQPRLLRALKTHLHADSKDKLILLKLQSLYEKDSITMDDIHNRGMLRAHLNIHSVPWLRANFGLDIVDSIKSVPKGYKVLTLAHDPTMTTIHISFTYRRPIPSSAGTNAGGKKIDKNAPVSTEQVSVYQHFSVDPRKLETAKIAWSMLRNELFNHEREAIQTGDNAHLQTFIEEQVLHGDTTSSKFQIAVDALSAYLKDVLDFVGELLPTEEPVAQLEPEKKDPKAKGGKVTAGQAAVVTTEWRSHYVLLLDQVFGDLPLESCLPFGDVASISRDFHIQMFVRRLRSISASPSGVSTESAAAAPGGAKKKGTATGTETSSKPEIVDRFEMDLSKLSYIIDPKSAHMTYAGVFEAGIFPANAFNDEKKNAAALAAEWKGTVGNVDHLDRATLHDLLTAYPNFLFYGIDDFSGQVAASRLLDMDLAGCNVAFLLDKAHVDIVSLDNAHLVPSSEDTAIIMSLLGWNTVFLNRCHTSLVHNQKQIKDLLSAVVTKRDVATPLTLGEVFTGGPAKSLLQLTPVIYGVPNIALTSGK